MCCAATHVCSHAGSRRSARRARCAPWHRARCGCSARACRPRRRRSRWRGRRRWTTRSATFDLVVELADELVEHGLLHRPHLGRRLVGDRCVGGVDAVERKDRRLGALREFARCAGRACRQMVCAAASSSSSGTLRQAKPTACRGLAVELFAEEHHGHHGLLIGDAAKAPRVAAARVDTDLEKAGVELGSGPARMTSHASAMFMPAPTAAPLTAAMVGSEQCRDAQEPA